MAFVASFVRADIPEAERNEIKIRFEIDMCRYESQFANIDLIYRDIVTFAPDVDSKKNANFRDSDATVRFTRFDGHTLVDIQPTPGKTSRRDMINGSNPQYAFRIARKNPDRQLVLERVEMKADIKDLYADSSYPIHMVSRAAMKEMMPYLDQTEGRKVVSIISGPEQIEIRTERPNTGQTKSRTMRYVFGVNPMIHLISYEVNDWNGHSVATVNYGSPYNGVPLTQEFSGTGELTTGTRPPMSTKMILESCRSADADPVPCRLTHYGMAEPLGVEWKRPTPLYIWLILAAVGLGIVALMLRFMSRRHSRTSPSPS